jgi:formylglycine-generating enzyme required for sulfatase activity
MSDRETRRNRHRETALKQPALAILSDLPLDQDEAFRDTFSLDFRLGPIYDILRHPKTKTPMAIAIHGDWGSGKTSAMRWLDDKLAVWTRDGTVGDEPDQKISVKTVWFYPWKYHSKEDVWRGLISEVIIKSLDVDGATIATVTNAAKRFGGFLGRSFVQVLANIKLKGSVKCPGDKVSLDGELSLSAIKQILDEYREANHPEKAFLNEFEETLKSWLRDTLDPNERMVIFIDDLDRCLPEVALEVLEALKLYLNIDKLLFVVGIDRTVVNQLVQKHYEELGLDKEKSGKYLAKMFQAEVPVEPSERQTAAYLADQLGDIGLWRDKLSDEERTLFEDIILGRAESNPREVKRLINSALVFGAGALMGSEGAIDEKDRVSFAQGLQFFFVREILDKRHGRARLQSQDVGKAFFAVWSGIVSADVNVPRTLSLGATRVPERAEDPETALPESAEAIPEAYKALVANPSFRPLLFLLKDTDLGELMCIPYPQAEALAAQMARPVDPESLIRELLGGMVRVPAGTFRMGGDEGDDEKPTHLVTLAPFEIGATPVTQAQYEAVTGINPSHFKDPDSPVESVSWEDAMAFCKKLGEREKCTFTLPAEAQWEYACRAGSPKRFCFGDNDDGLDEYAWYDKNSEGRTHPVAKKKPNAWGLYDMHGNVWEWCGDWYSDTYYQDGAMDNPTGPAW